VEYLVPKATADTVVYFADWSKQLQGDTISTFELTVTAGTITIPETPENHWRFLRFLVAGGADGEMATLACTVHTVGLQTLTRELQLFVSDGVESVTPSTVTKRVVCEMAFEECGLAGYEFDRTAEEWQTVLRRLDTLQAEWRTSELDLGYNAPAVVGQGDLDDESGLPDDSLNATALTLALRICPPIGKTLSVESKVALSTSMDQLRTRYGPKAERRLPRNTPMGAGNKPWSTWWPYANRGWRR
jgi:hypothetical protein